MKKWIVTKLKDIWDFIDTLMAWVLVGFALGFGLSGGVTVFYGLYFADLVK